METRQQETGASSILNGIILRGGWVASLHWKYYEKNMPRSEGLGWNGDFLRVEDLSGWMDRSIHSVATVFRSIRLHGSRLEQCSNISRPVCQRIDSCKKGCECKACQVLPKKKKNVCWEMCS